MTEPQPAPFDGALVVDKPEGWTSHDVVAKMRRIARTRRIGHLGTLDPIATGVLPLLIGRATRLAQFFTRNDKVYEAVIRFGFATGTYDRAGTPTTAETGMTLNTTELDRRLDRFRGTFLQIPPPVSAKKIGGVPAYKLARKQQPVELQPIEVTVHELVILGVEGATARVRCHCSAGTYLRSIAHDIGAELGCGAHLQELRRTASGDFILDRARPITELEQLAADNRLGEALLPMADLLPEFPSQIVDDVTETRIQQGRDFAVSPFRSNRRAKYVKALSRHGDLLAIGELKLPNLCHPVVVL
ncbi:MAG: tRNA pseudouridine(55) synthase TruB [Bryobacteraceae bacterium]